MNRILLLEDDVSLIDGLVYSLKKNEFDVEVARTVCEAKQYLSELDRYDLLILDVTLPDGTGFDVCERVRKENQQIPIIFLTASDEEVSIIRGLDSGGDDYITKPFKLGELCSRIRALLRRAGVSDNGNGIVPEDIYHIFKRFYRSKHSLDTQGIGLGLPLAKSIIEGQNGVISVQSEVGKGTLFTLSFLTDL